MALVQELKAVHGLSEVVQNGRLGRRGPSTGGSECGTVPVAIPGAIADGTLHSGTIETFLAPGMAIFIEAPHGRPRPKPAPRSATIADRRPGLHPRRCRSAKLCTDLPPPGHLGPPGELVLYDVEGTFTDPLVRRGYEEGLRALLPRCPGRRSPSPGTRRRSNRWTSSASASAPAWSTGHAHRRRGGPSKKLDRHRQNGAGVRRRRFPGERQAAIARHPTPVRHTPPGGPSGPSGQGRHRPSGVAKLGLLLLRTSRKTPPTASSSAPTPNASTPTTPSGLQEPLPVRRLPLPPQAASPATSAGTCEKNVFDAEAAQPGAPRTGHRPRARNGPTCARPGNARATDP